MDDFGNILDVASKVTIIGLLFGILWGGIKKLWVWGWLYDQMFTDFAARLAALEADYKARLAASEAEIAEWKQRALEQMGVNKDTVDSLKKLVSLASKAQPTDTTTPSKGGS